ncbi:MAG TPA: hypothetical protein VNG12_13010 [Acidimicrobiales bacterium]|nr:hypothetical protein [Acidimicrobiales bacterium]
MTTIRSFPNATVEQLAIRIAEPHIGSQLAAIMRTVRIEHDPSGTKWRWLKAALVERQRRDGCGSNVAAFVTQALRPVHHTSRPERRDCGRG